MPVHVMKAGGKWRVVEPSEKIAKNASGTAADGGGHANRAAAVAQVHAINLAERHRKGLKTPSPPKR